MPANSYLEALAHFNAYDAEVSRVAVDVLGVGNQLQNNRAFFSFSNTPHQLPPEALLTQRSASLEADSWPDVTKIMRLLERWHKARDEMRSAWSKVPENLRSGLVAPPTDVIDVVRNVV